MSTQTSYIVRVSQARETALERTAAWAIVAATCLVMALGPFLFA